MPKSFRCLLACTCACAVLAVVPQARSTTSDNFAGAVTGTMLEQGSQGPAESVVVTLQTTDGTVAQSAVTDSRGRFAMDKVPPGAYVLIYHRIGTESRMSAPFSVDEEHRQIDLGTLYPADPIMRMDRMTVTAAQGTILNTIDRKTYFAGRDIQSATGSASDLLQNLPSVQVDIDGAVSLRGSGSVLILVNGRTSALMGRSRAEALQQLPADSIEKIEVITNPSAKYKPDGTAGIINIVLKRKREGRSSSTLNGALGNDGRHNAGVYTGHNAGGFAVWGSQGMRQDARQRHSSEMRTMTDPVTGQVSSLERKTVEQARPLSHSTRAGIDWRINDANTLGAHGNYSHRSFTRSATDDNVARDSGGTVLSDYTRTRLDPEFERSLEVAVTGEHAFGDEGHELHLEFKASATREEENNRYANIHRFPATVTTHENTLIRNQDRDTEVTVEYTRPIDGQSKLEAGYVRTTGRLDADFRGETFDLSTGRWIPDPAVTNRFTGDTTIHAFYGTYGRTLGKFGFLAGLRPEAARTQSRLVTTGETIPNDYFRVYPSLHMAYRPAEAHELQVNYSHRVRRPDIDDLNPFPEYQDPFNLRVGNPYLLPEDIHSVEAGYSLKGDGTNITATVYHRYLYHGFTSVTRDIGQGVLLSTRENLSQSRSTGLELTVNRETGRMVAFNFSSNVFFNTIDASNLGYRENKSNVSWIAKLGASLRLPRNTLCQFNANYVSERLTPQGFRRPSFVANLGLRHDVVPKKVSVILTVSDLFNSLRETSVLDAPGLRQTIVRRRNARIIYLGFVFNFGRPAKKTQEDPMKFDNTL